MAEGNFQADAQDFESILPKTDAHGYLCELEYSSEDLKRRERRRRWLQQLQPTDKPSLLARMSKLVVSKDVLFGYTN